jgi:hypothetical protein
MSPMAVGTNKKGSTSEKKKSPGALEASHPLILNMHAHGTTTSLYKNVSNLFFF